MNVRNQMVTRAVTLSLVCFATAVAQADDDELEFDLVRAKVSASCAPNATGHVSVKTLGNVEVMDVRVEGLPPKTEFDVFVIQVPKFPFGLSWYQGDLETRRNGKGYARFVGRFNEETFIVAPDIAPAPSVHSSPNPDATVSPKTGPIHTYHLGIWFNSPADAIAAGCPPNVTPFNGEHNAGIQILNTSNRPDLAGPLIDLKP